MLNIAPKALAPDVLPPKKGFHRRIEHEPLGIVLDIAAWNYPLLIAVNVVVPALLAGNGVLIKHSIKTPLCGGHFESAFNSAMTGLVQNLILTHDQTLAIFKEGLIDHPVFTGSVTGGKEIHRAVAAHFIDVGLELGGKDAAYVAEDADLAFTVSSVVDGACYNSGQSCCAVEQAYVHRNCYDAFIERAEAVMSEYRLGDPLDENTTMGPLASRAALDLLDRQVADAVARGARLILGGKRMPATDGNFFLPTLLVDVPNDAEVMQAESFGPILPVLAVENDQEAVERMNDSRFGLTASVWTGSREKAEMVRPALEGRHRLPEPLRLSRPGPALDRGRRQRQRVESLDVWLLSLDAPQEYSLPDRNLNGRRQPMPPPGFGTALFYSNLN